MISVVWRKKKKKTATVIFSQEKCRRKMVYTYRLQAISLQKEVTRNYFDLCVYFRNLKIIQTVYCLY